MRCIGIFDPACSPKGGSIQSFDTEQEAQNIAQFLQQDDEKLKDPIDYRFCEGGPI